MSRAPGWPRPPRPTLRDLRYHRVVPRSPGPLLRLVHTLERRRTGRSYALTLELRQHNPSGGPSTLIGTSRQNATGPRAFVVGSGERVDLAVPSGLMPRHVAILAVPRGDAVILRALSLHPDRGLVVESMDSDGGATAIVGGVTARSGVRLGLDGLSLVARAELDGSNDAGEPTVIETQPNGEQLAFWNGAPVRAVGDVVASVTGPVGGGHAIPALVFQARAELARHGSLLLRARSGVMRVEVTDDDLQRGLLIGRSRRCVIGRGFDENDGLSRVHALILGLDDGVYAFDLASRYGLRDVSRPSRMVSVSRLDDAVGCLVYGAGYLTYEA